MMLQDKVAVITGGSGAVGRAIVRILAREGCRVAYTYKSGAERARQLQDELVAAGAQVGAWPLDVLDGKAAAALAETIERQFGPIDILVNNAGLAQILPFAMIEERDWDEMMDVNVKGMFLVTKAFARGMIRRKRGSIVNVGSLAGVRMLEVPVHYATAKSAVVGFTLSLARELGRYKVRVNAVVPGMLTGGVSVNVPVKQQEEYKRYCALSRAGEPEEVAELVAFLASDRAGYINGQAIHIDGGI
jgi:3-oxoacyl-[acyl-carrier protein] reductase